MELLDVVENYTGHVYTVPSIPLPTQSTATRLSDFSFVPISLTDLLEVMKTLIKFSSTSADEHLLLDTGAFWSIWSEDWLQKPSWKALKQVQFSPSTPPFRFSGHPVRDLYGVPLAVRNVYIYGKQHILKIIAYTRFCTLILFHLGFTEQKRHGFEICLWEYYSGLLRISKLNKVFRLTVTSHVWLNCGPLSLCSPESSHWKELFAKFMFDSVTTPTKALAHSVNHRVPHDAEWNVEANKASTLLLQPSRRNG